MRATEAFASIHMVMLMMMRKAPSVKAHIFMLCSAAAAAVVFRTVVDRDSHTVWKRRNDRANELVHQFYMIKEGNCVRNELCSSN